jgi:hypothetical protein
MFRIKITIAALAVAVAFVPAAQAAPQAQETATVHVAKKHEKVRAHSSR